MCYYKTLHYTVNSDRNYISGGERQCTSIRSLDVVSHRYSRNVGQCKGRRTLESCQ